MTVHAKGPYWIEIDYLASGYGPHTMTRPTTDWVGVPFETEGVFIAHDGSDRSPTTMVTQLVDIMLPLFTDEVQFTNWTIYQQLTADVDPVPVYSALLTAKIGTASTSTQWWTFEKTFTFKTTANNYARLILLDCPTGGTVSKTSIVSGQELLLVNAFMSVINAWTGRDGERPAIFRSLSNGVNDALKRAYRL